MITYRRRLDPEGNPPRPTPKARETVWVPRALSVDEERTLAAVTKWVREGRSSQAVTPLSELIDDPGGWSVPNIRLGRRSERVMAWWRVCALHAVAAHRDQLEDFKALVERIEGQDVDDMALLRGLEMASQMIQATAAREHRFARQRGLDRPEEVAEPQQETGVAGIRGCGPPTYRQTFGDSVEDLAVRAVSVGDALSNHWPKL